MDSFRLKKLRIIQKTVTQTSDVLCFELSPCQKILYIALRQTEIASNRNCPIIVVDSERYKLIGIRDIRQNLSDCIYKCFGCCTEIGSIPI